MFICLFAASMGPRPFSRGNLFVFNRLSRVRRWASMGPRPFSRGNAAVRRRGVYHATASMGPRPFSRGNVLAGNFAVGIVFASMGPRPFSRGNTSVQYGVPCSHPASMGPRPFSRGNGNRWHRWQGDGLASMGPRPFSRGNSPTQSRRCCRIPRFNGATTFQPWKRALPSHLLSRLLWLQWGHDLSAVETRSKGKKQDRQGEASMGPRPFSRGNRRALNAT